MLLARLAAALTLAGCCEPLTIIDQFPVAVDLDGGVPILGARAAELAVGALRAVIDTSSPVTVFDEDVEGTTRRRLELELLRAPAPPGGLGVPRARFECAPALIAAVGAVGVDAPDDIAGIIGGDLLSRVAVRLDPSRGELRFFPNIGGGDATHEDACTAVMRVTLAGGGTYIAGNDAVNFTPSRVVLGVCLSPEATGPPGGTDTLLVVATGIRPTLLSRTTAKAALGGVDDAFIDALPETRIFLPGDIEQFGEVARAARVPRMALTGRVAGRGPCEELRRSRAYAACPAGQGDCTPPPCPDTPCAAATVDVDQEIDIVIVPDTHPLLQGLRNELRPENADVAGLLGMQALGSLVTDLDYPAGRVLVRCAPGAVGCSVRPRINSLEREAELRGRGCY